MPEHYGLYVDNLSPEQRRERAEREAARRGQRVRVRPMLADITVRQAMTSWTFWALVLGAGFAAFAGGPLGIFQNIRMGALGYTTLEAAAYYSGNRACTYIGRGLVLVIGDRAAERVPIRYLVAGCYIFRCIAMFIFAFGTLPWHFYLWAFLDGTFAGVLTPIIGVLMGAYFGRQAFGTIYGLRLAVSGLGGLVSPTLTGWIADVATWDLAFAIVAGFFLGAVLFYALAWPPKQQTREQGTG